MEDSGDYTLENLHRCSYRFLQQTAKAMSLPSNVKKMYLVQLIHTKKYCSTEQVDNLIKQVRFERQQLALVRKKAKNKKKHVQQSAEISSTSNSKSPPISVTPKRVSHIMIRYSPDLYTPPKRTNRTKTLAHATSTITASDRVLRSYRSVKKPTYVLNNALIGIYKSSSSEESVKSIGRVTSVSQVDKYQQVDMKSLLKKRNVGWRNGNEIVQQTQNGWKCSEIVPTHRHMGTHMSPQPLRQRRLSGIYPLTEETKKPSILKVSVRRADGTLSKINAIIQKPAQSLTERHDRKSLLNTDTESNTTISALSIDNFSNTTVSSMLNMSLENSINYENTPEDINLSSYKENQGEYTTYYHKKIRAEQVRSLRNREPPQCVGNECKLPKINDVFSKFSNVYGRDVTQPIYVQVTSEQEIAPNPPLLYPELNNYQTTMLENLYNLKNVFMVNQPLLQIATTTNTRCVYSTPIISTAKAQPSANISSLYNIALPQDSPQFCMEDSRVHDFFRNFRCDEALSDTTIGVRRTSSSENSLQSQDLGANVTIPEMVEDALELISQDGDYMERMGMDIRMQCILCNWAGPKIILEYHIRKEHSDEIVQAECSEWCATYTLGELWSRARGAWLSQVLERAATLYIVSAKYHDPDGFCATLKMLSSEDDTPITGSITTYNKVTGEPFTWKGVIEQLPPNLPYDDNPNCLKLELSRMNLLPNSANLKLLNRELVVESPTKVVVGQPELDNIHITLMVKLFV